VATKGQISINMRLWVVANFVSEGRYENIYEYSARAAELSGRLQDEILREKLGPYFVRRTTFDNLLINGRQMQYAALNIGGVGPARYGEFCVVFTIESRSGGTPIVYLKADSLVDYTDTSGRVDVDKVRQDLAAEESKHHLAAAKHFDKIGQTPDGELSPQGHFLMKIGSFGEVPRPDDAYAVTYLGPFVSSLPTSTYPKAGLLNHPTDVAVDPDGDIYVTDWGNHRVCIFEADGTPLTNLYGDSQVMSKWGAQSVDANPDMMKAYRRVRNLEPLWRFCFPTAVDFNPATDEIIVADSQRNRLQVYRKVRDYQDFQANL
jgi:hypothetical protein